MAAVSVVLPSIRAPRIAHPSWRSVCESARHSASEVEVVVSLDRLRTAADDEFLKRNSDVLRLVSSGMLTGSSQTRLTGMAAATGTIVLFTDDDCVVPLGWVDSMIDALSTAPVVSGALRARDRDNWLSRSEEFTDDVRTHSVTHDGAVKFVSFPNMGARREVLPEPLYANSPYNTAEDVDLSLRLTLAGTAIQMRDDITVDVTYPTGWRAEFRRKRKHGFGVAFVKAQFTAADWRSADIGSPLTILNRWVRHSLSAPFPAPRRAQYLVINLIYCGSLLIWPSRHGNRVNRATRH